MKRPWLALSAALASCCPQRPAPAAPTVVAPAPAPTPAPAPPAPPPDAWTASGVDWTRPPGAAPEPAFTPPVPQTFEVAGAQVVLVENHRLPLVSVRAVFRRAGSREDGLRAGLAALTSDLLVEGAGRFDAVTLPEELERLGARLDVGIRADAATLSLDTMRDTLEPSLGLLASAIAQPRLARKDFDRLRGDRLADLAVRPDHPRELAVVAFSKLVFGAHPYAPPATGFTSTVRKLTLGDVKAFWKRRFGPADCTLVIAGDVDRATLEPLLVKAFTGWRGGPAPRATQPTAPTAGGPVIGFVDRPGAPQSVVVIGRAGAASGDPRYFPSEVLNTAIGGSFMSRLNGRLREELGYTYGASSRFWRGRWGGSWAMVTSFQTAVTIDGVREALAIVDGARTAALPDDELGKAVLLMTRSAPQAFETNAGIAGAFEDLVIEGLPLDWYQGWIPGVRGVTAAAAQGAVEELWKEPAIVIVGDWAALKDGLAGLKRTIVQLDAEGNPVKR